MRSARTALSPLLSLILVIGIVTPIAAASATKYTTYSNGTRLTANIWTGNQSWGNCFDFQSSSVITATPTWIKNTVTLRANGLWATITSWSFGSGQGNPVSATWTNANGARGAYLSGSACASLGSISISAWSNAQASYLGVVKGVTANF